MMTHRCTVYLFCFVLLQSGRVLEAIAACTAYCNAGTLTAASTCRNTVTGTGVCTGAYTQSGSNCVAPLPCGCLGKLYDNAGLCFNGQSSAPAGNSCYPSDGGPGGFYCNDGNSVRCYTNPGTSSPSCPSGTKSGNNCVTGFPMGYSCPAGYTQIGNSTSSCYTDNPSSTIMTPLQCTTAAPATDGCRWCPVVTLCLPAASTCPATCQDAASSICTLPPSSCQWCASGPSIGVCQPSSMQCYGSCLAASANVAVCGASSDCKYCTTPGSIGVCQPSSVACYTTCLAASAEPSVCDVSVSCQYCGVPSSIGVCQPNAGTCWGSCTLASLDPLGSGVCSTSTACQWCPSDTSIGVCQPNAGTCWATCTPVSDDALGSGVCTASADCKWCATLGYCTERPRTCHEACTTVARDEPGICQMQSIQPQCEWCGAPTSVEYCVARGGATCATSCGELIWRQDVCDGALECHWCGVHGGRCKPLPGTSRGYVAWRREVECDTGSESLSSSASMPSSVTTADTGSETSSDSVTNSATHSTTTSLPPSVSASVGGTSSRTRLATATLVVSGSTSALRTESSTPSPSGTRTRSLSSSLTTVSTVTLSPRASITTSMSPGTATYMPSLTSTQSSTHTNASSTSPTMELTASRYYHRDRTILETAVVSLSTGLSLLSVAGGGGAMVSSLSRVVAARGVGQCWGQAGSSIFNWPVDACEGSGSGDADQLEAQGDAVVGVSLTLAGIIGLSLCWVVYSRVRRVTLRASSEDVSLASVLTPLWVAVLPAVAGGGAVVVVSPMSSEHPLAVTCAGTASLAGACLLVVVLVLLAVAVVPLAAPSVYCVSCVSTRGKALSETDDEAANRSLLRRIVRFFHRGGQRQWRWEPGDSASTAHRIVRTLLLEYRALWYAALDGTVVLLVSVLGAVGPLLPWGPCVGLGGAVVGLLVVQLAACVAGRPMTKPFDWSVCSATLALTTVSSVLRLVYGASQTDDERTDREVLLTAASILDLMVSILTLGPIVLDVVEVMKTLCKPSAAAALPVDEGTELAIVLVNSEMEAKHDKELELLLEHVDVDDVLQLATVAEGDTCEATVVAAEDDDELAAFIAGVLEGGDLTMGGEEDDQQELKELAPTGLALIEEARQNGTALQDAYHVHEDDDADST